MFLEEGDNSPGRMAASPASRTNMVVAMRTKPWIDEENALVVADYFEMLGEELAGREFNRKERARQLVPLLRSCSGQERTLGAIEYKRQNISAVLASLKTEWIRGYRPAWNFQKALIEAVIRQIYGESDFDTNEAGIHGQGVPDPRQISFDPPPEPGQPTPPKDMEAVLGVVNQFDFAGRDARNRALGEAGEKLVFECERATLRDCGVPSLAEKVRWISKDEGDGAGYDIASFGPDGRPRLIEVKTTTQRWRRAPFHITRNEFAVSKQRRTEWRLVRLWDFNRKPQAFELCPPLDRHVSLSATNFLASFHRGAGDPKEN